MARSRYYRPLSLEQWLKRSIKTAKQRAKTLGLGFDLDLDYLKFIWTGICPVFQIELNFQHEGRNLRNQPSLDCIKPQFGYSKGNVAFVSFFANAIKQNATSIELYQVANWLAQMEQSRQTE